MQVIETNDPVEAQRCRRGPICRLPNRSNLGRVEVRWPGAVRETGSWPAMDRHDYSKTT